jgi:hypothetical protein
VKEWELEIGLAIETVSKATRAMNDALNDNVVAALGIADQITPTPAPS